MTDEHGKKPTGAGKSSFALVNVDKVFSAIDLKPGTVFLDVACGSGIYSLEAAKRIGETGFVYGVDLWEDGIKLFEERIAEQGITNVKPLHCDASKMPLDDKSIDTCLMATVLHDFVDDGNADKVLDEVTRLLKPDGTLAILEFKKIDGPPGPPIHIRMTPEEVEGKLEPFGLTLKSREVLDVGPYNYLMLFSGKS